MTIHRHPKELGSFRLFLNHNGSVIIWCADHQVAVLAAHAGRHFNQSHNKLSP
jgi:hypothetical protein